ncbi:MAG: class II aldolase/adducin family protein [candidate division KSB1 bacterium]|nr:class II aldolase/adducin family protein [candidate division KSB1 bacterium]
MSTNEWQLKKTILDIGKRLWERRYVASNDGNITVRMNDNELLTTPTGVSKGFMTQDMIIKMNMDGKVLSGSSKYRPSSEAKMHIQVYKQREDIASVVHAHPPYCTSFAVAGIPLNKCVLPEAILTLGAVPIAPYGTPSTMEIPDSIKPYAQNSDAILLANHGALTFGTDLINAYHKMETLEHSAEIVHYAIQLGNVNMIPQDQVDKLMQVREQMNIPGRINLCSANNGSQADQIDETQIESITREVINRLNKS